MHFVASACSDYHGMHVFHGIYMQVFVVGYSDLMKWFGFCDQYNLLVLTLAAWMPVQLYNYIYMTGFERTRLPRTQQEDTPGFSPSHGSCTH